MKQATSAYPAPPGINTTPPEDFYGQMQNYMRQRAMMGGIAPMPGPPRMEQFGQAAVPGTLPLAKRGQPQDVSRGILL